MAYGGKQNWNIVDVVFLILFKGHWVSTRAVFKSLAPFVIVMGLGLWLAKWYFAAGWAIFAVLITSWFLVGTYVFKGLVQV